MSTMTLEQVRDWHREQADLCRNSIGAYLGDKACGPIAKRHDAMADAIDARLAQPAQDHEAHCNLRHPATLGTSEDHCDCAVSQPTQAVDVGAGWNALLAEAKRLFLQQMAERQPGIDWSNRFHKLSADTRLEWVMQAADRLIPTRALSGEKAGSVEDEWNSRAAKLLRDLEFSALCGRRCPCCLGWNDQNGETDRQHTKDCELAALIATSSTPGKEG